MVASSVVSYGTNVITFLRIKRQSGVFKLYFNGIEKSLTNSTNSGDLNNDKNIHLFKEYNESTPVHILMILVFMEYQYSIDSILVCID